MTYRWQGHFAGDPAAYRPEDEVSYWVNDRDPLKLTRQSSLRGSRLSRLCSRRLKRKKKNMCRRCLNSLWRVSIRELRLQQHIHMLIERWN